MSTSPKELLQKTYEKLMSFYDLAEELIDTVEHKNIESPLAQMEFIEPLVERVEHATDVLTEEYRYFASSGKTPDEERKVRIENALTSIYDVLGRCDELPELED